MNTGLWKYAKEQLRRIYGENPPIEILERFEREKNDFKENSRLAEYLLLLCWLRRELEASNNDMFCRGDINNLFTGWLIGATKVNPLPPHYYCPKCKKIEFVSDVRDGWDLPEKSCDCGGVMRGDGHNLTSSLLKLRKLGGIDINLPVSYKGRIMSFLELFYGARYKENVFRFHTLIDETDDPGCERYVMLDEYECRDFPENKKDIYMDHEKYRDEYGDDPYILVVYQDYLDFLKTACDEIGISLKDIDLTDKVILDAFKSDGVYRPYMDFLVDERREFEKNYGSDFPEDINTLQYYLDRYTFNSFSDLLRYEGVSHNTYANSEQDIDEMIRCFAPEVIIAFREDVYDYIFSHMKEKGIDAEALAASISNNARKGKYSFERMDSETKHILRYIGASDEYIEKLENSLYLFPRGHCIDWLRLHMMGAWIAVNHSVIYDSRIEDLMQKKITRGSIDARVGW